MRILIILLFISIQAFGQKKDSIQQLNKYMDSVVAHTSVLQLNEWMYTHLTAKEFNDYTPFFQFFLRQKQAEYLKNYKP
jgi:hypothetical protein